MNEITILSGKGGTGKTTITAALTAVAENTVFTDCDVDAADLHLIFEPETKEEHRFESGWEVLIDQDSCTRCGICKDLCRFEAIHYKESGGFEINPYQCEGCRLCERACPVQAITSKALDNNFWYVSDTRFGTMVHARMGAGEENSGRLVTKVRDRAKEIAREQQAENMINDGPPGIGCPVISSLSKVPKVLMVIEPTHSGLHDTRRLIELVRQFNASLYALINKYDLNEEFTGKIEKMLEENDIPLVGKIPFDETFVNAMVQKQTITEYRPESPVAGIIRKVWEKIR